MEMTGMVLSLFQLCSRDVLTCGGIRVWGCWRIENMPRFSGIQSLQSLDSARLLTSLPEW